MIASMVAWLALSLLAAPFSVVDPSGAPVAYESLPSDVKHELRGMGKAYRDELRAEAVAIVVVRVPPDANSALIGKDWRGGMHVAGAQQPQPVRAIRLMDFDANVTLRIEQLGFVPQELAVPTKDVKGKLIWFGDVTLAKADPASAVVVKGLVVDPSGNPLAAKGTASLRVNGTPAGRASELVAGEFRFDDISAGEYLVEFAIDGWAVDTWWVKVASTQMETRLTAYPRQTLTFAVHATDGAKPTVTTLEAGIPYGDEYLPLGDKEELRISQEGVKLALYSPLHKITVAKGPFTSVAAHTTAAGGGGWYSWEGSLVAGQLVVLVPDAKKGRGKPFVVEVILVK